MTQQEAHRRPILWWLPIVALNVSFWIVAPVMTLIYGCGTVLYATIVHYLLRNPRFTKRVIRRSLSYYAAILLRCGWPLVRVRFVDFDPGQKPPVVLVANHRSSSDGFMLAFVPFECVEILNIWPSRLPIVGAIGRVAEFLRVREMPFDEFLEAGSRLISVGCSVIAFPEGTRSGSRALGQFHGAAFRLAQHCSVSVVPIAIAGNEKIPPRGSALLRPGRITVTRLPPITPAEYAGMSPYQLKNLARDRIRTYMDTIEPGGGH